jgi:hypothetical protein
LTYNCLKDKRSFSEAGVDPDDNNPPSQDDDHPPGPGSNMNPFGGPDRSHPQGDPGLPRDGWLSWRYDPEEVEDEWDGADSDFELVTDSDSETDEEGEAELLNATHKQIHGWILDVISSEPFATKHHVFDAIGEDLQLNGIQVPRGTYAALQRNAAIPKDFARMVPKPVVVVVRINENPARALLDSGSLGDFMSTSLADQLKVKKTALEKPLTLQLAVQGSR